MSNQIKVTEGATQNKNLILKWKSELEDDGLLTIGMRVFSTWLLGKDAAGEVVVLIKKIFKTDKEGLIRLEIKNFEGTVNLIVGDVYDIHMYGMAKLYVKYKYWQERFKRLGLKNQQEIEDKLCDITRKYADDICSIRDETVWRIRKISS